MVAAVVAQLPAYVLQAHEQLGGAAHIRPGFHVRSRVRPTFTQESALGHQLSQALVQQIQPVGVVV